MAKRTITLYLSLIATINFFHAFFYATYSVFLRSIGLDAFEMNMVNACFMLGIVLLELPTGIIADVLGRKFSYVCGCFFFALSTLIYYFAYGMTGAILAELIGAVAVTLESGAAEAWLVDSLKHHGWKGQLEEVFSLEGKVIALSSVVGVVAGAYIGQVDLHLPWLIASLGTIMAGVFAFFTMEEKYFEKKPWPKGKFCRTLRKETLGIFSSGWQHIRADPKIMAVMVIGGVFSFAAAPINMYWPLLVHQHTQTVYSLGWTWGLISLAGLMGSHFVGKTAKTKAKVKHLFSLIIVVAGFGALSASLNTSLSWFLTWFFMHEVGRFAFGPMKKVYTQKRFKSRIRATLGSFDSLFGRFGSMIGLLVFGLLARSYSYELSWLISGVVFCLLAVIVLVANGKRSI